MLKPVYVFPQDEFTGLLEDKFQRQGGLEIRDYFAAKAMGGLFAGNPWTEDDFNDSESVGELRKTLDEVARLCYEAADAMVRARKPKDETGG